MSKKNIYSLFKSDEITIKDIVGVLQAAVFADFKIVICIFSFFILLGFLDYKLSPVEYQSDVTVFLESGSESENSAVGLAGLLNGSRVATSGGDPFGPAMYPKIVNSKAFLNALAVIKFPANPNTKDSISLEEYFAKGEPLSFSQKVKNLPLSLAHLFSEPVEVSTPKVVPLPKIVDTTLTVQSQISANMFFSNKVPPIVQLEGSRNMVISILGQRIKADVDAGAVTVSLKMPDSYMAAAVNKLLLEQLIKYVTSFNTVKHRTNIEFLERRFLESKVVYMEKQQNLAASRDNNLGAILQSAQIRQEMLVNEVTIAFNIHNQFAVELEAAKIDLKKETPLFRVLEPISLPSPQVEPSFSSKLLKYFLVAIFLTFLIMGYRLLVPKNIS
uniref:hypothetical protein n=1 Tax=Algoriphagus sp. TaxID=1872435 RepID=UPI004047292C